MDSVTSEIFNRLQWFIKLRWGAIIGTFLTALIIQPIFSLYLFSFSLIGLLLGMIVCNLFFVWLVNTMYSSHYEEKKAWLSPSGFANLQIGVDLLFLSFLWHNYGGIENPIIFFFVFHMIIAGILLPKLNSFFWAFFSSILLISIAYAEYSGLFRHHPILFQITGIELWNNSYWNVFLLSAFCFTLVCVVYMTTSISSRLKARNEAIIALEKQIAERKLQESEKKLFFSEKMAALGKLSAGMAHEINNPLTTILSYSECLADDLKDNEQQEDLQTIISETIRIRKIVKQILNFGRASEHTDIECVDINKEIEETLDMLRIQMDFINITFNRDLDKTIPNVYIAREHLKQVIINILVNASQAMEGKGSINIETFFNKAEGLVFQKFTDTGHGIPPDNLSCVFDPFFTTKKQGEGTGLGLSVSYGLIKMYEGNITVQSEEGKGTTFIISLPLCT
ncbi:MAG: hypothetical protein HQK83_15555 [Fibrobacteria bacterium]|nr:hypothetical protein [Fibrobacteria bacterium]